MKKTLSRSFSIIMVMMIAMVTSLSAQHFIPVKGSGPSVNKDFQVGNFHGIDVSHGFDVILVQGNSEKLTLTIQENLLQYVTVEVTGGVLRIYSDKNFMTTEPLKARITFKDISDIIVSGGGDITAETPLNVSKMNIHISGGGDISATINTSALNCEISGGGDVKLGGKADSYGIELSGGGDITSDVNAAKIACRVSGGGDVTLRGGGHASIAGVEISGGGDLNMTTDADKIDCSVSGGGDAKLNGKATEVKINLNGGGNLDARNLTASNLEFEVSGGSDIHVNVTNELTGQISGGGNIYYTGEPQKVSVDTRGGSKIKKE
jgi:hypothetical protein